MARRQSAGREDGRTRRFSEKSERKEEGKKYPREEKRAKTETEVTRTTTAIVRPAPEGYVSREEVERVASVFRNRGLIKRLTSNVTVNREYGTRARADCRILYLPCSFQAKCFAARRRCAQVNDKSNKTYLATFREII